MLNLVWEVVQCAHGCGLLRRVLRRSVTFSDPRQDDLDVPLSTQGPRLQQWLPVIHTPAVHVQTYAHRESESPAQSPLTNEHPRCQGRCRHHPGHQRSHRCRKLGEKIVLHKTTSYSVCNPVEKVEFFKKYYTTLLFWAISGSP